MLSTFLPFYLLPPVTKFRGVFEVESCFYLVISVSFSTGG